MRRTEGHGSTPAGLAVVRPSLNELEVLRDEPHRFLLDLRRAHGPAVLVRFGPSRFLLLSDPAPWRRIERRASEAVRLVARPDR